MSILSQFTVGSRPNCMPVPRWILQNTLESDLALPHLPLMRITCTHVPGVRTFSTCFARLSTKEVSVKNVCASFLI